MRQGYARADRRAPLRARAARRPGRREPSGPPRRGGRRSRASRRVFPRSARTSWDVGSVDSRAFPRSRSAPVKSPTARASVARLLLVVLAPLALDGCVSVGLARSVRDGGPGRHGRGRRGRLPDDGRPRLGVPVDHPVLAELTRIENGVRTTVARSMASSWSLGDLPPGRYVLRTSKKIDENGDVVPLKGPVEKEFDVGAGERVEAKRRPREGPRLLDRPRRHHGRLPRRSSRSTRRATDDSRFRLPRPLPPVFIGVALEIPFGRTSGPRRRRARRGRTSSPPRAPSSRRAGSP